MKTCFWCDLQKNGLNCVFVQTLGAILWSPTTLGAIFAQIFRDFTQIFRGFAQIFRNFVQILNKAKLLGVRLHPLHSEPSPESIQ